ncbi:N/A [soil metagenome]
MTAPRAIRLAAVSLLLLAAAPAAGQLPDTPRDLPRGNVDLVGLRTLTDAEARALIETQLDYIETNGASTARADDAAFFLESALLNRGYDDARVDWEMPSPGRIVLRVYEGGRLQLAGVISHGNQAITNEGLLELVTADTRDRLELTLEDEIPYVVEDVRAGRDHVKEFYELLGYVGAEVELLEPVIDPDPPGNRASVQLLINEGKIYKVGTLDLGPPPEPALADAFAVVHAEYAGENFSPSLASLVEDRLRKIAVGAGYFQAEVDVVAQDPVDAGAIRRVDLTTTADYGPKFYVNTIRLSGNERVRDRYFERMFDRVTGQAYDPDETHALVSSMLESGAFRRVTAIPEVVDDQAGTLDLVVDVEEAKHQELGFYAGYGTYEGPIVGTEYRHLNLFGLVRRFDSKIEASYRGLTGEVTYIDPWFLWSDWEARIGLFSVARINEGYSKIETGLRAELRREFQDAHAVSFFAQGSYTDIYEAEINQPFLGDEAYLDSFLGMSYELDRLDDKGTPRRGFLFRTSTSIASTALGGDVDYLRSTVRLNYHIPVGPTTIHLGARSGVLYRLGGGDDVLPIDLRFFSGGARSVRSFPERELGPRADGFPIGGEFYSTFNVEYEIPIFGPLSLALFADAGNLIYDFEDAGLDDMHYAAGAGLRLNSPLGPLRIDYGHNLNRGENEPSGSIHIGFGVAF